MKKISKDWFIPAPWGNIALVSWGDPTGEPVFLVHGRQDSAATFIPLVDLLPDRYYFVAIDLPGNGKSDQFPVGIPPWRYYYISAIDIAIKHLKWDKFICIGHSMGCELGLFYNGVCPGHIKKLILLDPLKTLTRLQLRDPQKYFKVFIETYYDNYNDYNYGYKVYTKRKALDAVKRARGLNEEQAEIILSRNLIKLGHDKYRLRWDKRTLSIVPQNLDNEYYSDIFSKSCPPILYIHMTMGTKGVDSEMLDEASELTELLKKKCDYIKHVTLEGDHDAHLMSPDVMLEYIKEFLNQEFVKAKL